MRQARLKRNEIVRETESKAEPDLHWWSSGSIVEPVGTGLQHGGSMRERSREIVWLSSTLSVHEREVVIEKQSSTQYYRLVELRSVSLMLVQQK